VSLLNKRPFTCVVSQGGAVLGALDLDAPSPVVGMYSNVENAPPVPAPMFFMEWPRKMSRFVGDGDRRVLPCVCNTNLN
jgi:hypothetical protein